VRQASFQLKIIVLFAVLVLALLGGRIADEYRQVELVGRLSADAARLWNTPYFRLGNLPVTPAFLVKALLFLVGLSFVCRWVSRALSRFLLNRTPLDEGQRYAMDRVITYAVYIIGLLIGLETIGVNLSTVTVFGGAIGIGIGFGLQSIMSNFVSGLILLFERPIKVGDRIEIGGLDGTVSRIGARSTWMRTNDNIVMILPNTEFIVKPVVNWTAHSRQVRFRLPFSLPNNIDPNEVRRVLLEVAAANSDVMDDPAAEVALTGFADKNLTYELRVWTSTRIETHQVLKSDLNFAIFEAFRRHGIVTPEPPPEAPPAQENAEEGPPLIDDPGRL
jgi:small-conductance mechanosensitive channel